MRRANDGDMAFPQNCPSSGPRDPYMTAPRDFRCRYTYQIDYGHPRHIWVVIGAKGALHLHISDLREALTQSGGPRYTGGIEMHYRQPPRYLAHTPPSQDQCWILHGPCWHDGSSLQAEERWIPLWLSNPHDHDGMFRALCASARDQFRKENEDEQEQR